VQSLFNARENRDLEVTEERMFKVISTLFAFYYSFSFSFLSFEFAAGILISGTLSLN